MGARKEDLVTGEYYHVYNRGVDKRIIIQDKSDLDRFALGIKEFNSEKPIGSLYENSFMKPQLGRETSKLVEFVAYCINPNHFHLILKQNIDNGVSEFMKRLGGGYTKYFNIKNKRNGVLFQGVFRSKHIDTNEYLLRVSTYVNLNNKLHGDVNESSNLSKSSWDEYLGLGLSDENPICSTKLILEQFKNLEEYKIFAFDTLEDIKMNKQKEKELEY